MLTFMHANPYQPPVGPYQPPVGEQLSSRHKRLLAAYLWLLVMTFGGSMATLSLFASTAWDGSVTIYDLQNQIHLFAAAISLGLAIASGLCTYASLLISRPHLRVTLLALVGVIAIGLLFLVDWPVSSFFTYFDLANVLAFYVTLGLVPSILIATVPPSKRKYWHAVIPYATLAIMVAYVTNRPS